MKRTKLPTVVDHDHGQALVQLFVHRRTSENCVQNSPFLIIKGVDFFAVAVHEIGHSLGLSHSPEDGSVMNPYYKHYDSSSFSLGYDDILAVYDLYVSKPLQDENDSWDDIDRSAETTTTTTTTTSTTTTTRPVRTTTWLPHVTYVGDDETVDDHKRHDPTHGVPDPEYPPTPTPATPDGCEGHFSAVSYLRGELFIFKNNYMWRLTAPGRVETGYPVSIHRMFHKLPQSLQRIDAAYERDTDSNIVFFSGNKYWVYNGNDIVEGSPRPITDYGLPDTVKKVDAVMVWAKNRKTYLFSGDRFWRYNETSRMVDSGYPRRIELFRGVPPNLDSAMTWSDDRYIWIFVKERFVYLGHEDEETYISLVTLAEEICHKMELLTDINTYFLNVAEETFKLNDITNKNSEPTIQNCYVLPRDTLYTLALTTADEMASTTYFFKNNLYWAFNNTWLKTEPFYPQQASEYWLGCH
ncbi:Matrix metalloproteinase-15 [Homalodisca vitripennis]|nr:Matrix metalloproteinase-15 [Homalodisca vitripennis]